MGLSRRTWPDKSLAVLIFDLTKAVRYRLTSVWNVLCRLHASTLQVNTAQTVMTVKQTGRAQITDCLFDFHNLLTNLSYRWIY
jgi:hypothetical protein